MYWRTAVWRNQIKVSSRRAGVTVARGGKSNPLSIRRPTSVVGCARFACELSLFSTRYRYQPHITQSTIVRPRRRPRGVSDARAVWRPLRITNREVSFSQSFLFFLIQIEQPEMRHLDVVIDDHRVVLNFLAILFVFVWLIDCGQHETFAIRRETKTADAAFV